MMIARFINRIFLFSLPLMVIYFVPVLFLYLSGENYSNIDALIKSNQNYLIGYAYNQGNHRYLKEKELESRNMPSVVAIGSSRILQFRAKMFKKSFYNAGHTVSSIGDFIPFLASNLTDKKPDIIIVNFDQWMFNAAWDDLKNYNGNQSIFKSNFNSKASVFTIFDVWHDLFSGKYGLELLFNTSSNPSIRKVGLNAKVNNKGFRRDGSMQYGNQILKLLNNDSTAEDFGFKETFSRMDRGIRRFEYGNELNIKSLQAVEDLLEYCHQNKIYLIAIIPPFAEKVFSRINQSGKYDYMAKIETELRPLFRSYPFELWNFSHLSAIQSNDKEFLDGYHGGEVAYLRMLLDMVEHGSRLRFYTDTQKLELDLHNRVSDLSVYPE